MSSQTLPFHPQSCLVLSLYHILSSLSLSFEDFDPAPGLLLAATPDFRKVRRKPTISFQLTSMIKGAARLLFLYAL
jgi:hypothetical protein